MTKTDEEFVAEAKAMVEDLKKLGAESDESWIKVKEEDGLEVHRKGNYSNFEFNLKFVVVDKDGIFVLVRGRGIINSPIDVVFDLVSDVKYRKLYDHTCIEMKNVKELPENVTLSKF